MGLAFFITTTTALRAFDCDLPGSKTTVMDLRGPEHYHKATSDFGEEREEDVQIIQTDNDLSWTAIQCKVVVSRTVTRCGFGSLTYGMRPTQWMHVVRISPSDCKQVAESKEITIEGNTYSDLKMGVAVSRSYFSHGHVDDQGNCYTEGFTRGGVRYSKSYEYTSLQILVQQLDARVDRKNDAIHFTGAHLLEKFSRGSMLDDHYGTILWETKNEDDCQADVSEFYRGVAKVVPRQGSTERVRNGDVVIVGRMDEELGARKQHLGLVLGAAVTLCQRNCYEVTAMPSYVVCPYLQDKPQLLEAKFQPHLLDDVQHLSLDVLARSDYQLVHSMLYHEGRLSALTQKACELERESKANQLNMLANGNEYALAEEPGYGPGFQVTAAGP